MANIRFIFFVMGLSWALNGYADTARYPNIVFENTQITDLRNLLISAFTVTKFNGFYKLYVDVDGNELLVSLRENKQKGAQGQVGVFIQGVECSEASESECLTHCKKYLIESIQSLKFRHVSSNAVDAKFKRNTLFAKKAQLLHHLAILLQDHPDLQITQDQVEVIRFIVGGTQIEIEYFFLNESPDEFGVKINYLFGDEDLFKSLKEKITAKFNEAEDVVLDEVHFIY